MSLAEKISQKLMLDFRYWCPVGEPDCKNGLVKANPSVIEILNDYHISGLILFRENIQSLRQITQLTTEIQKAMKGTPLLISTDQEGGIVTRMPANQTATFSGNMAIGAATLGQARGHNDYSYAVGNALGNQLKSVGISIDNAPDVDVNANPKNPVINVRAFSDDPSLVAKLAEEMLHGIQAAGVAATLKHFPGHGDTDTDIAKHP